MEKGKKKSRQQMNMTIEVVVDVAAKTRGKVLRCEEDLGAVEDEAGKKRHKKGEMVGVVEVKSKKMMAVRVMVGIRGNGGGGKERV